MDRIQIKRIYEESSKSDGYRVLIDRLWPRGVRKEEADIDLWAKDVAPSAELRTWFGHDPERWTDFRRRYLAELKKNPDALSTLKSHAAKGVVTLLYGAKDVEHNNAVVLKSVLEKH